jgi:hypothetical protein
MLRFVLLFTVSACLAQAQTISSSIVGTVTDASGAVVPGVKVTATNVGTGVQSATKTDDLGNYTIGQLPPGNYNVESEHTGFKKFVRPNITLEMTRQLRIDITLETGALTETVSVEATTPLLETETGQLSTTIENRQVTSLPTLGRNPQDFRLLVPE